MQILFPLLIGRKHKCGIHYLKTDIFFFVNYSNLKSLYSEVFHNKILQKSKTQFVNTLVSNYYFAHIILFTN